MTNPLEYSDELREGIPARWDFDCEDTGPVECLCAGSCWDWDNDEPK